MSFFSQVIEKMKKEEEDRRLKEWEKGGGGSILINDKTELAILTVQCSTHTRQKI